MRLWSLHPKYLDAKGLVAVWREALLAQAVLQGKTRGYLKHPQLDRFKAQAEPLAAIARYLWAIHAEATLRGYSFDGNKIGCPQESACTCISVSAGQLEYELQHLLEKLSVRDPSLHKQWGGLALPHCHPLFQVGPGAVESWERAPGSGNPRTLAPPLPGK